MLDLLQQLCTPFRPTLCLKFPYAGVIGRRAMLTGQQLEIGGRESSRRCHEDLMEEEVGTLDGRMAAWSPMQDTLRVLMILPTLLRQPRECFGGSVLKVLLEARNHMRGF